MFSVRKNPFVRRLLIFLRSVRWLKYYLSNSGVFANDNDVDTGRAKLRKDAHTIEKGLSLPEVRPLFAQDKILRLLDLIDRTRKLDGVQAEVDVAVAVLNSYLTWHEEQRCNDSFLDELRQRLKFSAPDPRLGGVIANSGRVTREMRDGFDSVILSRRTVRNFSDEKVPISDIKDAIRVAWSSPSACNRQPWSVFIEQDINGVARLLRWQAGHRGFERSIGTLLVVLADTKAFVEDYEIFEPFVDAGIFSGVLVNSLHARGIGSCCLNLCVSHKVAEKIILELDAPKHLFPVMMIACGYAAEGCEVPLSSRGNINILSQSVTSV